MKEKANNSGWLVLVLLLAAMFVIPALENNAGQSIVNDNFRAAGSKPQSKPSVITIGATVNKAK